MKIVDNNTKKSSEEFTRYEEAIFKAYLEENNIKSENLFHFKETNLEYYSSRYTSEWYSSPYEYAHVNGTVTDSIEFHENLKLLNSAKKWMQQTIHPEKSEYITEGDKYIHLSQAPIKVEEFISKLKEKINGYLYSTDILIMYENKIFQFLQNKEFLFKWRDNIDERRNIFYREGGFQFSNIDLKFDDASMFIFPIFVPIREMIFLGEYGYKNALIDHGAILQLITNASGAKSVKYFKSRKLHDWIQMDGVERSIIQYFVV